MYSSVGDPLVAISGMRNETFSYLVLLVSIFVRTGEVNSWREVLMISYGYGI